MPRRSHFAWLRLQLLSILYDLSLIDAIQENDASVLSYSLIFLSWTRPHLDILMSLISTFSARGAPSCLQPSYFTSAVFTSSAREDLVKLLSEFGSVVYLSSQPFTTFKELWIRQGWHFAHVFIIEAPTRDTYINTMFRLFAGSVLLPHHAILVC